MVRIDLEKHLSAFSDSYFSPGEVIGHGISGNASAGFSDNLSEEISKRMNLTMHKFILTKPTTYHFHKNRNELFIFRNNGKVLFDNVEFLVNKNSALYIPSGVKHKISPPQNQGGYYGSLNMEYLCIPYFDRSDIFNAEEE